ncbi:MAG: SoxR reducing system RseC family protein [Clostridia bacterium]|nr:SoxR reducing system RseC family protein [Clostridia bacterium]
MAMEQIGYVARIEDGIAKIRVDRESACGGNCSTCHGCPQTAVLVSYPDNQEHPFQVGEEVRVLMPTGKFFSGIMKSYGVLIFTVLAGTILG